eukprot:3679109-Amphidinium_carterae.2
MGNDWLEDEPQDKFETRKRRANEQREVEPVHVADLKKENAQLRKQLEILTSTLAELKEEVRMRQGQNSGGHTGIPGGQLREAPAPMDDGENVVEIFEERQEAVILFSRNRKEAVRAGKSFQLARLHHGSTMQAAQSESWNEVSGEGNVCFWRCLIKRHPQTDKAPGSR